MLYSSLASEHYHAPKIRRWKPFRVSQKNSCTDVPYARHRIPRYVENVLQYWTCMRCRCFERKAGPSCHFNFANKKPNIYSQQCEYFSILWRQRVWSRTKYLYGRTNQIDELSIKALRNKWPRTNDSWENRADPSNIKSLTIVINPKSKLAYSRIASSRARFIANWILEMAFTHRERCNLFRSIWFYYPSDCYNFAVSKPNGANTYIQRVKSNATHVAAKYISLINTEISLL